MKISFVPEDSPDPSLCTRREFLKKAAKAGTAALLMGTSLSGCGGLGRSRKDPEDVLKGDHYAKLTRGWDPIYEPPALETILTGRSNGDMIV